MAPSVAYIRSSTGLTPSSNPTIRRTLVSSRVHRNRDVAVRNLWWWGRNGSSSFSNDDNLEERLQRHQKIMRHRYSRAVRRRAMWDREDASSSWLSRCDGHPGRRWGTWRSISSSDPTMAKVQEKHELPGYGEHKQSLSKAQKDMSNFDRDYEAFKAAIDRAVDRDPYGAVFGRRFQSPPTENNSSWITWLFNLGEVPQEPATKPSSAPVKRKIETEVLDKKPPPKQNNPLTPPKANTVVTQVPIATNPSSEYIYDPITGRKVLKSNTKPETPTQSQQTFLEVLFSEHGAPSSKISVKHHKVYGHDAQEPKPNENSGKTNSTGFESSRKREYQQLRATMIGNSIDTTAEFGGKFEPQSTAEDGTGEARIRTLPKFDDDAPFSGTTYESKMSGPKQTGKSERSAWLAKEGFSNRQTDKPQEPEKNRLEPSFDRMSSSPEQKVPKFVTKLQPALDRVRLVKRTESARDTPVASTAPFAGPRSEAVSVTKKSPEVKPDTKEDMDLLRASDIRAATKSARTTKHEVVQAKIEKRNQLETDFDRLQQKQTEEAVPDAKQLRADSDRLSRSIERVRKHAEQYSDGIVAKTIQSLGVAGESFKMHEKPLNGFPAIDKAHSNAPKVSVTTESQDLQKANTTKTDLVAPTGSIPRSAEELWRRDNDQIEQLASGIRQVCEAEHGPIDLSLAQNSIAKPSTTREKPTVPTQSQKETTTTAAASTAALDFFVERTRFLQETNVLATHLSIVKAKTADLEADIENKSAESQDSSARTESLTAEAKSIADKADRLEVRIDQFIARDKAQEAKPSHPLSKATVKPGVPHYPDVERHTQVFEPRYIQLLCAVKSIRTSLQEIDANINRIEQDRKTNALQHVIETPAQPSQPLESNTTSAHRVETETGVKAGSEALSAPYLILVYNKTTGEVDQTPMERLPWSGTEKPEKISPIRVMGNLNYPAAFVTHFVVLEKAGYELSSGGGDMLVFQKKSPSPSVEPTTDSKPPLVPASKTLRNTIAVEEFSAQPEVSETIAQPSKVDAKQAATVLKDIPAEVVVPRPAAPTVTTPVSSTTSTEIPPKKSSRSGTKVRRQEQVFSGTLPLRSSSSTEQRSQSKSKSNAKTSATTLPPPPPSSNECSSSTTHKKSNSSSTHDDTNTNAEPNPSIFTRTTRTLKRGILGVTAFGVAAYTIGVVAEGIGAQAQVEGDTSTGPRRKLVMPTSSSGSSSTTAYGQRPGIYSTESSRD